MAGLKYCVLLYDYRVVLFDQRGAGKSTPAAELRENTSQHLVSDIEVKYCVLLYEVCPPGPPWR
jgi:pimeloyl-ACP methyl ester carboxylesterase